MLYKLHPHKTTGCSGFRLSIVLSNKLEDYSLVLPENFSGFYLDTKWDINRVFLNQQSNPNLEIYVIKKILYLFQNYQNFNSNLQMPRIKRKFHKASKPL
jgi:hypothetical protein